MEATIWKFFDIFSAIFCLIYALQTVIIKKNLHLYDRFFISFLINLGILLTFLGLVAFQLKKAVLLSLPLFSFAFLSLGPNMFLNIRSLVSPNSNGKHLRHFILPTIFLVSFLLGSILSLYATDTVKTWAIKFNIHLFFSTTFIFVFQNSWYIAGIIKQFKAHKENLKKYFTYSEQIELAWLKWHIFGYITFIVGMIVINLLPGPSEITSNIHRVFVFIYINFIGINALRQKPIYENHEKPEEVSESKEFSEKQKETIEQLKQRFEILIFQDKLYLDQELTIFKLSKLMDSNTNYLSTLINSTYQLNFANFINKQRVAYARQALLDQSNQQLTIESIGSASGFKSKSSFNAAFKKFTGKTPSEFMKNPN